MAATKVNQRNVDDKVVRADTAGNVTISGTETSGTGIGLTVRNTSTSGQVFAVYKMVVGSGNEGGIFFGSNAAVLSYGIVNGITFRAGTSTQDIGFSVGSATTGGASGPAMTIKSNGSVVVGANTTSASAIFEIASTTKGFLPPRMTTTQRDAISSPSDGLVIYNTTVSKLQVRAAGAWTDLQGGSTASTNSSAIISWRNDTGYLGQPNQSDNPYMYIQSADLGKIIIMDGEAQDLRFDNISGFVIAFSYSQFYFWNNGSSAYNGTNDTVVFTILKITNGVVTKLPFDYLY